MRASRALVMALGLTAALTAAGAGSASAAVSPSYTYSCGLDTITDTWQCDGYTTANVFQYDSIGIVFNVLPAGTRVTVTCWYHNDPDNGTTADGYWDHVSWDSKFGSIPGHVDDDYVYFGGHTPDQLGIPQC